MTVIRGLVINTQSVDSNGDVITDSIDNPAVNMVGETTEQGIIGGEKNTDSTINNYDAIHEEVNYSIVSVVDNITTVNSSPTFFYGLYVNSAIGEPLVVKDGTTAVFTIAAASMTANTYISFGNKGIRFETSLVIDPDDTSTETDLIVLWRPI